MIMKTLQPRKVILNLLAVALVAVLGAGCAWSIGGSKEAKAAVQPTKGQELLDLTRAKDSGALTDAEYEAQKQRILDK